MCHVKLWPASSPADYSNRLCSGPSSVRRVMEPRLPSWAASYRAAIRTQRTKVVKELGLEPSHLQSDHR